MKSSRAVKKIYCNPIFICDTCGENAWGDTYTESFKLPISMSEVQRIWMRALNSAMPVGWHRSGDKHTCPKCLDKK